jgi:hypothetical protein
MTTAQDADRVVDVMGLPQLAEVAEVGDPIGIHEDHMTLMTFTYVPFPAPTPAVSCEACGGQGVTGDRYELRIDGPVLLVDVFCPTCHGCGSAVHDKCADGVHALDDFDDPADDCPSCNGRGWNAVTAWSANHPDNDEPLFLRVPCGCTEDRAEQVDDPGDER